jgi:hypothetical protein
MNDDQFVAFKWSDDLLLISATLPFAALTKGLIELLPRASRVAHMSLLQGKQAQLHLLAAPAKVFLRLRSRLPCLRCLRHRLTSIETILMSLNMFVDM